MPNGHADKVIQSWIDFSLEDNVREDELGDQLTNLMVNSSDGPGRCFKCHTAPSAELKMQKVTWKIPSTDLRPFTEFNHTHLNVLNVGESCASCHKATSAISSASDANQSDPNPRQFEPIKKMFAANVIRREVCNKPVSLVTSIIQNQQ